MTRRQAKIFAKIHSYVTLSMIDSFAFMPTMGKTESPIPEKDQDKMIEEIKNLAEKIRGGLPEFADSITIYNFVIKHF